jgi:hypothetical protein
MLGLTTTSCGISSGASSGAWSAPQPAGATKSVAPSEPAAPQTPDRAVDLERTCVDGTGFAGLPARAAAKGKTHKAVMLTKDYADDWRVDSPPYGLPAALFVVDDSGDPSAVDTVVCTEQRLKAIPAGKTCQMSDSDTKKPVTVTLYNTVYRLRVREASTGKLLLDHTGLAASRQCPYMTLSLRAEDRNKHFNDPDSDVIERLIKRFIAP